MTRPSVGCPSRQIETGASTFTRGALRSRRARSRRTSASTSSGAAPPGKTWPAPACAGGFGAVRRRQDEQRDVSRAAASARIARTVSSAPSGSCSRSTMTREGRWAATARTVSSAVATSRSFQSLRRSQDGPSGRRLRAPSRRRIVGMGEFESESRSRVYSLSPGQIEAAGERAAAAGGRPRPPRSGRCRGSPRPRRTRGCAPGRPATRGARTGARRRRRSSGREKYERREAREIRRGRAMPARRSHFAWSGSSTYLPCVAPSAAAERLARSTNVYAA